MSKANNVIRKKYRSVKSAFNKFKDATVKVKISNDENQEMVLKLVLDNLSTEINRATETIKNMG